MDDRPNLVLIGFMATGKSTIGRRCAQALGFRFRDADRLIERRAGKPVTRIFGEDGEAAFRQMEVEAVRYLSHLRGLVIATGGGAPMDPLNVARLRRTGVVVLLCVDPDEIVRRAARRRTRPLLADAPDPRARVDELLAVRGPYYAAASHVAVETTGLTPDEAAERVLQAYQACARRRPGGARRATLEPGSESA